MLVATVYCTNIVAELDSTGVVGTAEPTNVPRSWAEDEEIEDDEFPSIAWTMSPSLNSRAENVRATIWFGGAWIVQLHLNAGNAAAMFEYPSEMAVLDSVTGTVVTV